MSRLVLCRRAAWPEDRRDLTLRGRVRRLLWEMRAVPVMVGIHAYVCAAVLGWDIYVRHNDSSVFYPALWPWVFLAAAVSSTWFVFRPSKRSWKWSAVFLAAVYMSRALSIVVSIVTDQTDQTAVAVVRAVTWALLAGLVDTVWSRHLVHTVTE